MLPQELQDNILWQLLNIHLLRGTLKISRFGHWSPRNGDTPKPNLSIMHALDKQRLGWAKKILYRTSNTWVMPPPFLIQAVFWDEWDPEDLRLLSCVQLRLVPESLEPDTLHQEGPNRVDFYPRACHITDDDTLDNFEGIWAYKKFDLRSLRRGDFMSNHTEEEELGRRMPIVRLLNRHPPKRVSGDPSSHTQVVSLYERVKWGIINYFQRSLETVNWDFMSANELMYLQGLAES